MIHKLFNYRLFHLLYRSFYQRRSGKPIGWWPDLTKMDTFSEVDNGVFIPTISEQTHRFPVAIDELSKPIRFFAGPSSGSPRLGYYEFRKAYIYSQHGWVADNQRVFQLRTSWYVDRQHRMHTAIPPKFDASIYIAGKTLSLASEFSGTNYGHFLLDSLSRIALLNLPLQAIAEGFDHYAFSGPESQWKKDLISRFNIPLEKVIWLRKRQTYLCEHLTVTSMPVRQNTYPQWLTHFLRANMMKSQSTKQGRKRYYLSRQGGTRVLENDDELFDIAKQFGYVRYEPSKAADSISDFSQADSVISPHGAALTDILFMEENSNVIELMPSDHRQCFFYTIGCSQKLNYHLIVGHSIGNKLGINFFPSEYDFTVCPIKFRRLLQKVHH